MLAAIHKMLDECGCSVRRIAPEELLRRGGGRIGRDGWVVKYKIVQRDTGPILAIFTAHRMTNDQYWELDAEGNHVFAWSSSCASPETAAHDQQASRRMQETVGEEAIHWMTRVEEDNASGASPRRPGQRVLPGRGGAAKPVEPEGLSQAGPTGGVELTREQHDGMLAAIRKMLASCVSAARLISPEQLLRHGRGRIHRGDWILDYNIVKREVGPVLAYFVANRTIDGRYCELDAAGNQVFSWSSWCGSPETAAHDREASRRLRETLGREVRHWIVRDAAGRTPVTIMQPVLERMLRHCGGAARDMATDELWRQGEGEIGRGGWRVCYKIYEKPAGPILAFLLSHPATDLCYYELDAKGNQVFAWTSVVLKPESPGAYEEAQNRMGATLGEKPPRPAKVVTLQEFEALVERSVAEMEMASQSKASQKNQAREADGGRFAGR